MAFLFSRAKPDGNLDAVKKVTESIGTLHGLQTSHAVGVINMIEKEPC